MNSPIRTMYHSMGERVVAAALLLALVGISAVPQIAAAKEDRPTFSGSISDSLVAFKTELQERGSDFLSLVKEEAIAAEGAEFPVASEREPSKTMKMLATAYSSDPRQTDSTPCITANGFDLCSYYEKYGNGNTIATNILPLGTVVQVTVGDEVKEYVVRDRMNARYNGQRRLDIWMPSTPEAKAFGVKWVEVKVFPKGVGK